MCSLSEPAVDTVTVYPERLLVYHSGTGKTVFIGCLKLTTIFLFIFSTLVLAPAYIQAPEKDWFMISAGQ